MEGHAGAFHVPHFGGHVSPLLSRSRVLSGLLSLPSGSRDSCPGWMSWGVSVTGPAHTGCSCGQPLANSARRARETFTTSPWDGKPFSGGGCGGYGNVRCPLQRRGAGDPQKRKDLADLLGCQPVYPKSELFWFAPYFMLAIVDYC